MTTPLFILGPGRCGSNYLRTLLVAHPRITMTNEAGVATFMAIMTSYSAVSRNEVFNNVSGLIHEDVSPSFVDFFSARARDILEEYYQTGFDDEEARYWGDKIGFGWLASYEHIQSLLPTAKFILLIRDLRDVLVSWRKWARKLDLMDHISLTTTAARLAEDWAAHYRRALSVLDDRLIVRYEDLILHPEKAVSDVLGFLRLPMCQEVEEELRNNDSFSFVGTSPSPAASLGRWKNELDDEESRIVEEIARPLMKLLDQA